MHEFVSLKHALTIFGLFSDLLGALLLSIPMIWDTRAAAHAVLKVMKRVKFWLYGYYSPAGIRRMLIFPEDIKEVHTRIITLGASFVIVFGSIMLRLIEIYSFSNKPSVFFLGSSPFLVTIGIVSGVIFTTLTLYFLGKAPRYIARGLIWIARANHERKIGFVGLGILCVGFILQATVNLM